MPRKFSIDFGTTNSVIACWNGEQRETVAAPGISVQVGEHFLIPSQLYVRDGRAGQVAIGAEVRANGLDGLHDNRLFRNFKRGIGADGTHEPRIIDGAPWTDADAGQHFMRRLLQALPYPPGEIEQLVVTAPVAAFAGYSAWLNAALDGFPPERVRIVDESTAAALGYAVTEPGANVLISDFGGGTLDLSLVRLPESLGSAAQVIAKVGINLGGSDVDQWLLADVLERSKLTPQSLGLGFAPLLSACEHAKIALSIADEMIIEVQNQPLHITRAELEAVMDKHGFFTALNQALDKLLGQAHQRGIFKEDVGHVLLVGGTSLIPSVQRSFDSYFRAVTQGRRRTSLPTWPAAHWTVENTSIRVDKPFTAVVEGALQISAGLVLDDQLTYSYGLLVADSATGQTRYEELIAAGSRYPSAPVTVHLAASAPGQQIVHLTLGQIDASAAGAVEVRYDAGQVSFVSQPEQNSQKIVPLNAADPVVLRLNPPGERGKERLSATFHVDAGRRLRLAVTDLKTHQKLFDGVIPLSPSAPAADGEKATGTLAQAPALAAKSSRGGFKLSLRNLASALHLLPPSQVSDQAWAAALRSSDPLVRFNAAEVLGKRGDREARLIMDDVLTNGAPAQRASAAQHIHRFSWFTAEGLFRRALQDDDPRVREGALFGLCKMRVPEAYRLALESLRDPVASDALRRAALWGASSRPDAGSVPMLEEIIATGTPDLREQALEVLGATGATSGIAVARRAVDDADLTTKYAAVFSWVELAGQACFADIATVITQTQGEARNAVLRGFFHGLNYIGADASAHAEADQLAAAFALALTDPLPQTRISAARALAWLRRPTAEQALRAGFAAETDGDVKAHMLRISVHLSSPIATELLQAAANDAAPLVRQTAEHLQDTKE